MKHVMTVVLAVLAIAIAGSFNQGRAQDPSKTPYYYAVNSSITHTGCAVSPGMTAWCYAGDGLWESDNGGAFFLVSKSSTSAGVTTFNGKSGDIIYNAPVASVNGKTGAVVISATTTSTTALN